MKPRPAPGILLGFAALLLVVHTLTNGRYGFHRDELATLDYARQPSISMDPRMVCRRR